MAGSCLQRHSRLRWQECRRSWFCTLRFPVAHLLLQQNALYLPPCDQVHRDREDPKLSDVPNNPTITQDAQVEALSCWSNKRNGVLRPEIPLHPSGQCTEVCSAVRNKGARTGCTRRLGTGDAVSKGGGHDPMRKAILPVSSPWPFSFAGHKK